MRLRLLSFGSSCGPSQRQRRAAALQRCAATLGERRYARAGAWGVTSAVLLARTPLHYQPWAIVLALTIVAVTVVALAADAARRRTNLLAVGAVGALSLLLVAGVVLENLASVRASLGTLYPGDGSRPVRPMPSRISSRRPA